MHALLIIYLQINPKFLSRQTVELEAAREGDSDRGRSGIEVIAPPMKCLLPQRHSLKDETESVAIRVFCVLTESCEALVRCEHVTVKMSEEGEK